MKWISERVQSYFWIFFLGGGDFFCFLRFGIFSTALPTFLSFWQHFPYIPVVFCDLVSFSWFRLLPFSLICCPQCPQVFLLRFSFSGISSDFGCVSVFPFGLMFSVSFLGFGFAAFLVHVAVPTACDDMSPSFWYHFSKTSAIFL